MNIVVKNRIERAVGLIAICVLIPVAFIFSIIFFLIDLILKPCLYLYFYIKDGDEEGANRLLNGIKSLNDKISDKILSHPMIDA